MRRVVGAAGVDADHPLRRSGLFAAKVIALAAVVVLQVALVAGVGKALGWRPHGNALVTFGLIAVGTIAFAAFGFTRVW